MISLIISSVSRIHPAPTPLALYPAKLDPTKSLSKFGIHHERAPSTLPSPLQPPLATCRQRCRSTAHKQQQKPQSGPANH